MAMYRCRASFILATALLALLSAHGTAETCGAKDGCAESGSDDLILLQRKTSPARSESVKGEVSDDEQESADAVPKWIAWMKKKGKVADACSIKDKISERMEIAADNMGALKEWLASEQHSCEEDEEQEEKGRCAAKPTDMKYQDVCPQKTPAEECRKYASHCRWLQPGDDEAPSKDKKKLPPKKPTKEKKEETKEKKEERPQKPTKGKGGKRGKGGKGGKPSQDPVDPPSSCDVKYPDFNQWGKKPEEGSSCTGCLMANRRDPNGKPTCHYRKDGCGREACQTEEGKLWCGDTTKPSTCPYKLLQSFEHQPRQT